MQFFAKMWEAVLIVRKYTSKLYSNTRSLNSILCSLSLKDYSLKKQRGKHVNNLVGLHTSWSRCNTQTHKE